MVSNFVKAPDGEDAQDFYADSPKGVVKKQGSSGSTGGDRGTDAPEKSIEKHRTIYYTDPHVHEGVNTILDWVVGDGYSINRRTIQGNVEGSSGESSGENDNTMTVKLRQLLANSKFWKVLNAWIQFAAHDGHAFMELVVEDERFKPKLLPTESMTVITDEYGRVENYELEPPGGGGSSDAITYDPHEVAELYFSKEPQEDFGRSLVEPISEQSDMVRDMEIDYARFVATKAYPPILWKLGTEDEKWTEKQVDEWMDNVQNVEPDSMLAAGHDVEAKVVGTTSTSSSAGSMRLEETFKHFQNRIVTGLGVPALLMNMGGGGQGEAVSAMPSFKRRIRRLQRIVKTAVEQQILKSLLVESALEDFSGRLPEFEFGEHSAAEERLDADMAIKLLNNGLLKPDAAARRVGIDPESELPDVWDGSDLIEVLQLLAGTGDSIQNPDGGKPTDTEGGTESAGGEATTRQDPEADSESSRNKKSVTEDEG